MYVCKAIFTQLRNLCIVAYLLRKDFIVNNFTIILSFFIFYLTRSVFLFSVDLGGGTHDKKMYVYITEQ
jgi:uncharacterized membrane protein YozB (DUF420 family)